MLKAESLGLESEVSWVVGLNDVGSRFLLWLVDFPRSLLFAHVYIDHLHIFDRILGGLSYIIRAYVQVTRL